MIEKVERLLTCYWVENIFAQKTCPFCNQALNTRLYQRSGMIRLPARECSSCGIFIPFIGAETAVRQDDISTEFLSLKTCEEIQQLLCHSEQNIFFSKSYLQAEQEQLQIILDAEMKKKLMREEKLQAECAAAKAKKDALSEQIASVFKSDYFAAEDYFTANNTENLLTHDEFLRLQNEYVKTWFGSLTPPANPAPDDMQTSAIGATQKNVEVVARAGSGKTATIVNRFLFLTRHCKIDASSLLLLAFNKKAALELHSKIESLFKTQQERASGMPHIMTFHALAYSIVHPQETLLYDDENAGSRELSRAVQSIIDEKLRDIFWSSKIRTVMLAHFKGNWEAIEAQGRNLTEEEQLLFRRSLPNQTLKGEYVKSYGEKVIANILFEHDIEYKYEKAFKWVDGTIYRPDFTIISADKPHTIIEYFGLAGDPEYDWQIKRKRAYWSSRKECLIELYPKDVGGNHDDLAAKLLELLTKLGISYRKLSEDEIWEKIKERAIDEFTKAITSFIGRCRKMDLSAETLNGIVQDYNSDFFSENIFLEIARSVYTKYLALLQHNNMEDFDGLLSRAVSCVRNGKTSFGKRDYRGDLKNLSHIMIDEYQDFSYLFDNFLGSIRAVCPDASIFCVGDDWQAINAFAGSDVRFFRHFTQRYENSAKYYLTTNYRSKKEIVAIGTRLMNDEANEKTIVAAKAGCGTVHLGYLTDFCPSPAEQDFHQSDILTPAVLRLVVHLLAQEKRVVLLTRTNDRFPLSFRCHVDIKGTRQDLFLASIQSFFPPDKQNQITASTSHKYKGKEEDAVIILDAMEGFYPLIHPSWVFQRVFGDTIEQLVEEEKRLFYVALSRAKENLYILTSKGEESPFINSLGEIDRLKWNDLPPLITDHVNIRVEICNQKGFSRFPTPTYAIRDLIKAADYKWDSKRQAWYLYCSSSKFNIADILNQNWTRRANHVILALYDEEDLPIGGYLLMDGQVSLVIEPQKLKEYCV